MGNYRTLAFRTTAKPPSPINWCSDFGGFWIIYPLLFLLFLFCLLAQNGGPRPFRSEGPVAPRRRFIFHSVYLLTSGNPAPLAGRGPAAIFLYCSASFFTLFYTMKGTKNWPAGPFPTLPTFYSAFILFPDSGISATGHANHAGRPAGGIYFSSI